MREGWGHAVRFSSGSSFRDYDSGISGADGSVRPAAGFADESFSDCGRPDADSFSNGEGRKGQGAKFDAKYAHIADVCLRRFNEQIGEIERWRSHEIVGFSAARLRAEAREAELNQAIVELSREDFLAGNFDLKSLFSLLFDRFYSEDFVLWLGPGETNGRTAAFGRMADVLEPINTLLEMGLASIVSFRATARAQDTDGNFVTDWETVLGGTYSTGRPVRWRTVRAWKSRMVIAERIEDLPSPNA